MRQFTVKGIDYYAETKAYLINIIEKKSGKLQKSYVNYGQGEEVAIADFTHTLLL